MKPKSQWHEVIVDVSAYPANAVSELRKDLWPRANVQLVAFAGPSGWPQCRVRLGTRRMIEFLKKYHDQDVDGWLLNQCTPPIPTEFVKGK